MTEKEAGRVARGQEGTQELISCGPEHRSGEKPHTAS